MLSASRYPYMNRAFRRNPDGYDKSRHPTTAPVIGYPLLLALLVRAGIMRDPASWEYNPAPTGPCHAPVIAAIIRAGRQAMNKVMSWFNRLVS